MTALAQYAAELDALVRSGRRIRLGDRNFEKPHADLDALLASLINLSDRMRAVDGGSVGHAFTGQHVLVTGRAQILHTVARRR